MTKRGTYSKKQGTIGKYSNLDNKRLKILLTLHGTTGKIKAKIIQNSGLNRADWDQLSTALNGMLVSGLVESHRSEESNNIIYCNTEKGDELAVDIKNFCEKTPQIENFLESFADFNAVVNRED